MPEPTNGQLGGRGWRCLWCGATARWRRDLRHTRLCAIVREARLEVPDA